MFKNIKKASEYSLLNESLVYIFKKQQPPEAKAEKLSPAEKAKRKLAALHSDVFYTLIDEEKKVMKMLVEGDAYKSGDWEKLNEKFYDLMGVDGKKGERYLTETQKQVFKELGLKGDTFAKVDGKLGPYTLYALAMSFGLKRPKIRIPAGSPNLVALINKDADEAFDSYKRFGFAKKANKYQFKKVYKDIMSSISDFLPEDATFGDWALALWESGNGRSVAKKIGFPSIYPVDHDKYPGKKIMKLRIVLDENKPPIFLDEKGEIFEYDKKSKKFIRPKAPIVFESAEALFGEEEKKKAPKSKPELKGVAQEYITNAIRGPGVRRFYRYPNGTFTNEKGEVVEAKDVVPLINRHEAETPAPESKKILGVDIANDEIAYYYPNGKLYGIAKERRRKAPEKPKKPAPKPKKPLPAPKPDMRPRGPEDEMKADDLIAKKPDGTTEMYYRFSDGTFKNSKLEDVPASEVPWALIADTTYARDKEGGGKEYFYGIKEGGKAIAYYDETGKRLHGRPGDSVKVPKGAPEVPVAIAKAPEPGRTRGLGAKKAPKGEPEAPIEWPELEPKYKVAIRPSPVRRTLLPEARKTLDKLTPKQVLSAMESRGLKKCTNPKKNVYTFEYLHKGGRDVVGQIMIDDEGYIAYMFKTRGQKNFPKRRPAGMSPTIASDAISRIIIPAAKTYSRERTTINYIDKLRKMSINKMEPDEVLFLMRYEGLDDCTFLKPNIYAFRHRVKGANDIVGNIVIDKGKRPRYGLKPSRGNFPPKWGRALSADTGGALRYVIHRSMAKYEEKLLAYENAPRIYKIQPAQIVEYMRLAGFKEIKPVKEHKHGHHFDFKLGGTTGHIVFNGPAIRFHFSGSETEFVPPQPRQLSKKRSEYRIEDMPEILGYISHHIENWPNDERNPNRKRKA